MSDATIADLQAQLDAVRAELAQLDADNRSGHPTLPGAEYLRQRGCLLRDILHLFERIERLKWETQP